MYVTSYEASLEEGEVENATITPNFGDALPSLYGLKSEASISVGCYMAGQNIGLAVAGDPGTQDVLDVVTHAAWGGQTFSGAADITGGVAAAPEVTGGHEANFGRYTWGRFRDDATGREYFRRVASVAAQTLTLDAGHSLDFAPGAGDTIGAVSQTYPNFVAMADASDPEHQLLQVAARASMTSSSGDEFYRLIGVRPELQLGGLTAGEAMQVTIPLHTIDFETPDQAIPAALDAEPQGAPGTVTGVATDTVVYLQPIGAALAHQEVWDTATINLGIVPEKIKGPNGREGVHGYGISNEAAKGTTIELTVPWDPSWRAQARARAEFSLLVQVGNGAGMWGLYFPRLCLHKAIEGGEGLRSCTLSLMARRPIVPPGLGPDEALRAAAKVEILRAA